MKIKYVICPGKIISQADGQHHYIGPMQLIRLYGLDPRECEIYDPQQWWPESFYRIAEERNCGLVKLGPRYDGNYKMSTEKFKVTNSRTIGSGTGNWPDGSGKQQNNSEVDGL